MALRHQRGWLKKEIRSQGETWMLFFRTTRKSDGKRVENKIPIGLVKDLLREKLCMGRSRKTASPRQPGGLPRMRNLCRSSAALCGT